MDFRNCPQCGKLFRYVTRNLCPACIAKEEEMYDIVREYVRDHPNANVMEVSEATGVPQRIIMNFVREGRFIAGSGATMTIECQSCGAPISSGQYCSRCSQRLARELKDRLRTEKSSSKEGSSENQRMYTADLFKKKNR